MKISACENQAFKTWAFSSLIVFFLHYTMTAEMWKQKGVGELKNWATKVKNTKIIH